MSSKYDELLGKLDLQQLEAVRAPRDVHVRIRACPGSGKTLTLVGRVCYLIEQLLVPESQIAAVTFSKAASADVSDRLLDGVECRTIHSLCYRLLCRVEDRSTGSGSEEEGAEAEVFNFDEFLFRLRDAIVSGKLLESHLDGLEFLFVDEFQDLAPIQFEIFRLLVLRFKVRIFGVGDELQNIYGFRKADSRFFDEMSQLPHFECQSFVLNRNYRSTTQIVTLANHLGNGVRDAFSKRTMVSLREGEGILPTLVCLQSKHSELAWIVAKVIDQLEYRRGCDIAIINRTKFDCNLLSHKLSERKVKNRVTLGDTYASGRKSKGWQDVVTICTSHGSKGLEWPVVFVSGIGDQHNRKLLTKREVDQESHLTFVAATRARDELHFTCMNECVSRALFDVPRPGALRSHPKDTLLGTVEPKFSRGRRDPYVRMDRSVSHFANTCDGETFVALKAAGLLPRNFPGATFERQHAAREFPDSFEDAKPLYGSIVERVIFRQVNAAVRAEAIAAGGSEALSLMMTPDSHANSCFLYVFVDWPRFNLPRPSADQVSFMKAEIAKEFGVTPEDVAEKSMTYRPSFMISKDILYGRARDDHHMALFERQVERVRRSYKRYLANDVDLDTEEGLATVADVAICAHLHTYPAFTSYLSRSPTQDLDSSLFSQTGRVLRGLIRAHAVRDPLQAVVQNIPKLCSSKFLYTRFGATYDVTLETQGLIGVVDLIIGRTLFEIKCSAERGSVKIEWILQMMIYASMASQRGFEIDEIAVYNPLKGYLWRTPIGSYCRDKGKQLLRFVSANVASKVDHVTRET
jgi:hypothetical protein